MLRVPSCSRCEEGIAHRAKRRKAKYVRCTADGSELKVADPPFLRRTESSKFVDQIRSLGAVCKFRVAGFGLRFARKVAESKRSHSL